jgi:RHS repeat-associated protein
MSRFIRALSLFAVAGVLPILATAITPAPAAAQGCSGSLQSISPCTGSAKLPPGTWSGLLTYTITNNNNTDAATYTFSCAPSTLAICTFAPTALVIPAHSNRTFTVTYLTTSVGAAGTLTFNAWGGDDDLAATIALVVNNVQITPKSLVVADSVLTTYKQVFAVKNLSNVSAAISLTKTCDSGVTNCLGPSPASLTVGGGATATDTVTYTSKTEGVSGWVRLIGTDNAHSASVDTGSINVTVPSPLPPAVATTPHNGDNRAVGLCALACFDVIASYSTPAYTSYDTPRSATVVYSSAQAAPVGEVQLDVTDPSWRKADLIELELKRPNGSSVTFTNGTTQLWFAQTSKGALTRVSGQFDASGDSTGVYSYTAIVTLKWTAGVDNNITTSTSVPVSVLELNQRGSAFGAGWSLAGAQRLLFSSDSLTIGLIDGAGSMVRFTRLNKTAPATAVAADFSKILTNLSGGTTVTGYTRTLPDGAALTYGVTGYLLSVRNRFNDSTRFHYDGSNRVDSIIDPAGKTLRLTYVSGKLGTITDPGGRVSTFTVNGTSGNLTSVADPTGIITFAGTYDAAHRLQQRTDRRGGSWITRYDFAGKLASDSTPAVWADSVTQRIGTRYKSLQSVVLIDPASGKGSAASPAPQVKTDTVRLAVIAPSGDIVRYTVDKFGAPTTIEAPAVKDTTWLSRNSNSQVTRTLQKRRGKTMANATATWAGSWPQLLSSTDSLTGATISYSYDINYNLLTEVTGSTTNRKFFLNVARTWVDSTCIESAGACTDTTTRFWHDAHGRDTLVVDAQKDSTKATFDVAGTAFRNLLTVRTGNRTTTYKYDSYGRAIWIRNPRGDSAMISMDSLNRTRTVRGAQGTVVTFAYDSVFLKSITDPKGQVYTYYRNPLGWLDSLKNANTNDPAANRIDKYEYTKLGTLKAHVNRRGQRTSMTYDAHGALATRTLSDGRVSTFAHDTLYQLWSSASNAEGSDTVRTDSAGLKQIEIAIRGSHWSKDSVVADLTGLVRSFNFSSDATDGSASLTYGYDINRRLDSMVVGGALTAFLYNRDGMLTKTILPTLPTKDTITYAITGAHASYSVTHSVSALNTTFGANYTRDALDRLLQRTKPALDTSWTYSYDSLGRISQYQILKDTSALSCSPDPNGMDGMTCTSAHGEQVIGQSTFTYDSVGNPTDLGAVVIPGNRLTTYNGFTLTYDYDGNLTHKQKSGFDQYLWWNSIGQLDSVRTNSDTARFGYDAAGRRVRKTVGKPGSHYTLRYFYSGPQVVAEVDSATNTAVRVYTYYGLDAPHSVKTAGKTYYYYQELGAGHVIGLVSGDSTKIKNRYRYQPFGQLGDSLEGVANPQRFTGREYDAETQLYYYRARYYDPSVARFISEDPIGQEGGVNQYAYASDDPVNRNDPTGLDDNVTGVVGRCPPSIIVYADGSCGVPSGNMVTSLGLGMNYVMSWQDIDAAIREQIAELQQTNNLIHWQEAMEAMNAQEAGPALTLTLDAPAGTTLSFAQFSSVLRPEPATMHVDARAGMRGCPSGKVNEHIDGTWNGREMGSVAVVWSAMFAAWDYASNAPPGAYRMYFVQAKTTIPGTPIKVYFGGNGAIQCSDGTGSMVGVVEWY